MIAVRAPLYLPVGIATIVAAGIWAAQPAPTRPSAPSVSPPVAGEQIGMRWQQDEPDCSIDDISSIVIRGQFTSREQTNEGFTISFAGSTGRYTAMTDPTGYFEVRIPSEDFEGDPCELPLNHRHFTDETMTLQYSIDVEH